MGVKLLTNYMINLYLEVDWSCQISKNLIKTNDLFVDSSWPYIFF
jgi:hypothetical protein